MTAKDVDLKKQQILTLTLIKQNLYRCKFSPEKVFLHVVFALVGLAIQQRSGRLKTTCTWNSLPARTTFRQFSIHVSVRAGETRT